MDIKYKYALNEIGEPVDVVNLKRCEHKNKFLYKCLGCGSELIPRLGDIKQKHFAHKNLNCNCSKETYLHQLYKNVFLQEYSLCIKNNMPFYLKRKVPVLCKKCENYGITCTIDAIEEHDLTKYFDKICIEGRSNGFVADILLTSTKSGDVLFIEFAVTHRCEDKKIKSNTRIIEFLISDEKLLGILKEHTIRTWHNYAIPYNFKIGEIKSIDHNSSCTSKIDVFIVYQSKKSCLSQLKANIDVEKQLKGKVTYYEVCGKARNDKDAIINEFIQKVFKAYFEKKAQIVNCYLCKYHGMDGIENAIFCKVDHISVGSNYAVDCGKYRPFKTLNEALQTYEKNSEWCRKRKRDHSIDILIKKLFPLVCV